VKTIAVVPTRRGSKGLPGKNMQRLGYESLIEIALKQGKRTCDHVVLVTDAEEHEEHARELGHETMLIDREVGDDELPEAKTRDAIALFPHVFAPFDTIVRLFVTQPLRSDDDIARAIQLYADTGTTVVGASRASFREHQVLEALPGGGVGFRENAKNPRQAIRDPDLYVNGTVYVASLERFIRRGFWEAPVNCVEVHPLRALDVDDHEDLRAARMLWPIHQRLWGLRP